MQKPRLYSDNWLQSIKDSIEYNKTLQEPLDIVIDEVGSGCDDMKRIDLFINNGYDVSISAYTQYSSKKFRLSATPTQKRKGSIIVWSTFEDNM